MTDQQLETEIREAFERRHVASPGLENNVIAELPWHVPAPARRASVTPRLAGALVAVVAVVLIGALVVPTLFSRLQSYLPGSGGGEPPAYSLGAVTGNSVFIVQRQNALSAPAPNVLLESTDGGHTWINRLDFGAIYAGMQMFGATGFVWSIDIGMPESCRPAGCPQPSMALLLYRTLDGGAHWTALPQTDFPAEDAFFLDGRHGWVDSTPIGLNTEFLYQTTDGGTTWSRVGPLPKDSPMGYVYGAGLYRVTFSREADGSLRGWYIGQTHLWTSTDGGQSWQAVTFPVPAPVDGWIVSPEQPAFAGQSGVIAVAYRDPKGADNATANSIYLYVTADGGATWTDPRPAPAGFAPVGDDLSIAVLDPNHVWLTSLSLSGGDNVQAAPAVAQSSNGGATWHVTRNTPRILQMMIVDLHRGYALVVSGPDNVNEIFTTGDGGRTWQQLTVPMFTVAKAS